MAEIAQTALDFEGAPAVAWSRLAHAAGSWLQEVEVPMRDAVLLVPLAQHLGPARQAFGALGGWLPRIETPRTLAASLGVPPARPEGAITFDLARDRLVARRMLREQTWARDWAVRDPQGFDQTVGSLVDCAHRLAQRAAATAPALRAAWTSRGRSLLAEGDEPGALERMLARVAFEWVAASEPWPTDVLFSLEPGAWMALQAAGPPMLAQALMLEAAARVPCLLLQADAQADGEPSQVMAPTQLEAVACDDFEDEAERAAARLIDWLDQGLQPLALIALDRVLVRRVAALLARQRVPVLDETGWKLSTTRAAAGVMALLRAASPVASTDEVLDWLKALPQGLPGLAAHAVDAFEHALRRKACARREGLEGLQLEGAASATRDWVLQRLQGLGSGRATLAQWMRVLREALQGSGQWPALQADVAGTQVLAALRLHAPDPAWLAMAEAMPLRWHEFVETVDELLEQAVFEPPAPPGPPAVVITPLRRAVLRPFAAALLPGADERRLGAAAAPDPLLGEAVSVALGLPSTEQQQRDEAQALALLLRVARVTVSWRHQEQGETLEPSLLVQRLLLARERSGVPLSAAADPRPCQALTTRTPARPAPTAEGRLPASLSASAVEALRDCPYRFFARSVLRLNEPEELDDEAEKRDYGTWLHAVLWRFHRDRGKPRKVEEDLAVLREIALQERDRCGLDDASFLPFEASFERFAGRYVDWVHEREAKGAAWLEGESDRELRPMEFGGVALRGRIDRIDSLPGGRGTRELIDYKTSATDKLRKRVRQPLEDTQLAFYAALELLREDAEPPRELKACYLALDDSDDISTFEHKEVEASARTLLDQLSAEIDRIRHGAPLPALGEGEVCEHCEARGLCRRDHWTDPR